MARQKQKRVKTSKKSRIITRILGATLVLFILLVLLFVAVKFFTADENTHSVLPDTRQQNGQQTTELARQIGEQTNQTEPEPGEQRAKYSFYDELKERSTEVEAEINAKIEESERQQRAIEGDNYRIQVGAFRDKDKADRLRARIILRDYPVMILRSNSMYLVQVGPYKARNEALAIQKRLEREGMTTLLKNYVAQ